MRGWSVEQCLERDLKEQVVDLLKIPIQHLDPEENWADFGFDSIHLAQFATRLSEYYGLDITPSLFFGQSTIAKLTGYFMDEHHETVEAFYREGKRQTAPEEDTKQMSAGVKWEPDPDMDHALSSHKKALKTEEIRTGAAKPASVSNAAPSERKLSGLAEPEPSSEPIAIIGMSGRFPEARTIDDMWEILSEGKSAVREVPLDRFDWRRHTREAEAGGEKVFCRWSGTVPGADEFDPMFFEISPREAELIDPRQRLLLQESWKALEDAGYGEERVKESTIGMFVGVEDGDYQLLTMDQGNITSNHNAVLAARLSYFLNLTGPNMAINTACSSGLVAVHQACMSLRNGECDTAIAAGVNLLLTPNAYDGISRAGILSEDGICYAFDQRANGTVPGEAVAVIVLKRLSKAVQDQDPIYAVIRGSGVNYDGKTNGITAPSGTAQAGLIRQVYRQYQIDPEQIGYIATHGTGTKLGDPVEINALNEAFRTFTSKQRYCAVTSTKTNFGHTFAASGLVSLISLVMSLRHGIIPASLNCEQENEYIRWDDSPFYVNKAKREWDAFDGDKRMGAVSAFGMSGTNAHMVVESYLVTNDGPASEQPPYYLLTLSAKTREALEERAADLMACLRGREWADEELRRMSYTLLQGRHHFQYRCALVVQDREDAKAVLQQAFQGANTPNFFEGRVSRHFTAQRAIQQYIQDLLNRSLDQVKQPPSYRDTLLALADLYCQGYPIDGKQLFGGDLPGMMHLPAYPFAREHYWVQTAGDEDTVTGKPDPGQSDKGRTQDAGGQPGLDHDSDMNRVQDKAFEPEPTLALDHRHTEDQESVIPINVFKDDGKARAAAAEHLRILVAEVTGIPYDRLEDEASFEEIGLDSLTIHGLNAKVEQWIGTLDSTLFYKYNNIKQLADYLAQEYGNAVLGRLNQITIAQSDPVPDDLTLHDNDPAQPEKPDVSWTPVMPSGAASSRREPKSGELAGRNEEATGPSASKGGSADIAIIGLAGRYPKADTLEQFWTNLYEGRDCIEEIPATRWPLNGFYEPDRVKAVAQGLSYSKWGGFLDRIEYFDPLFFNISPRDAMYMDPQERLFLETAWECVEDAGYTRDALKQDGYGNQIGVFVGATFNNYQLFMADAANRANQGQYLATSQMFSIANRVSYVMNFTGPSLTVDTACSSSLYAVHLACESIRSGQSRMAIAGGVNLTLHPSKYITLCQGQFNASDGRCRAFAEGGTGYVPSEAVGAVLLKPGPRFHLCGH
jgi:polyketide synthase PksN